MEKVFCPFELDYQRHVSSHLYQLKPSPSLVLLLRQAFKRKPKPKNILVLGCGVGNLCYFLKDQFPRGAMVGLDISPTAIGWALNHPWADNDGNRGGVGEGSLSFYVGDVGTIEGWECLKNKTFDSIIDDHLLSCIVSASARSIYLSQVVRHLQPHGFFLGESLVQNKSMALDSSLSFDHTSGILYGPSGSPLRRVPTSYELEQELLCSPMKIETFIYQFQFEWDYPGVHGLNFLSFSTTIT
jgi:SAM-dependent methyltransferase